MSDAAAVRVVIRSRPPNARERGTGGSGGDVILTMTENQAILTNPALKEPKKFTFDRCYWSTNKADAHYAPQELLYSDLGVSVLNNAFAGYNTCLMAYGQTSAGKTYTMMGAEGDPGLIPRLCADLFARIASCEEAAVSAGEVVMHTVEVSYMEIYNENVKDLLSDRRATGPASAAGHHLRVREHPITGPYVEGLRTVAVTTEKDIAALIEQGNRVRTTASTNMNDVSSRSHAIFTIKFDQVRYLDGTDTLEGAMEKSSKINLVDLAGSERQSHTLATGDRLREGAAINKSLSTLGLVISTLAKRGAGGSSSKKKELFVAYRNSALTWLLRDSLGGNSKTIMLAAISPVLDCYDESLSTLRYANEAKKIVNHATVNEDPNLRLIRELRAELEELRAAIKGEGLVVTSSDGKAEIARLEAEVGRRDAVIAGLRNVWEERFEVTRGVMERWRMGLVEEVCERALRVNFDLPHFVAVNEDTVETGVMVYAIREGETRIGNGEGCGLRLKEGDGVEEEHCVVSFGSGGGEGDDGAGSDTEFTVELRAVKGVTVLNDAKVVAEGETVVLHHGDSVTLGNCDVLRYNNAQEAEEMRCRDAVLMAAAAIEAGEAVVVGGDAVVSVMATETPVLTPQQPMRKRRESAAAALGSAQRVMMQAKVDEEEEEEEEEKEKEKAERQRKHDVEQDQVVVAKTKVVDPATMERAEALLALPIVATETTAELIDELVRLVKNGEVDENVREAMVKRVIELRVAQMKKETDEAELGLTTRVEKLREREEELVVHKSILEQKLYQAESKLESLSQNMGSTTALPTHTQVEVVRFESVSEGVSSYIAYVIHVRCRHEEWTVTRRYTDFFEFSKQVSRLFQLPVPFPPKRFKFLSRGDEFVEERRHKLDLYVRHAVMAFLMVPMSMVQLHPCRRTLCETIPFLDPTMHNYSQLTFGRSAMGSQSAGLEETPRTRPSAQPTPRRTPAPLLHPVLSSSSTTAATTAGAGAPSSRSPPQSRLSFGHQSPSPTPLEFDADDPFDLPSGRPPSPLRTYSVVLRDNPLFANDDSPYS